MGKRDVKFSSCTSVLQVDMSLPKSIPLHTLLTEAPTGP